MIRYPGGKSKFKKQIIKIIDKYNFNKDNIYVEPFLGSGAIGFSLIEYKKVKNIFFNDRDIGISSLWQSVYKYQDKLIKLMGLFKPSVDLFNEIKDNFAEGEENLFKKFSIYEIGFLKLALHQMSYSGLGAKAGGPIGGKRQSSKYKIDCRWNSDYIIKEINKYHKLFNSVNIMGDSFFCDDFFHFCEELDKEDCFYYLDPPYYEKGNELYQYGFTEEEHIKLSNFLKKTRNKWLLSYDNSDKIREIYNWAYIKEIEMNCTINKPNIKKELLIIPKEYKEIFEDKTEDLGKNLEEIEW